MAAAAPLTAAVGRHLAAAGRLLAAAFRLADVFRSAAESATPGKAAIPLRGALSCGRTVGRSVLIMVTAAARGAEQPLLKTAANAIGGGFRLCRGKARSPSRASFRFTALKRNAAAQAY